MFERNRVDQRAQFNSVDRPVLITLNDGSQVRGRMVMRETRKLADELNEGGGFIEVYPYGRDPMMLSKAAIRSITETNVPAVNQLENAVRQAERFDPHAILGVTAGADEGAVRRAYHALSKSYHPDRFASMDVPDEIIEYVCAVSRRLNVAYAELTAAAPATPSPDTTRDPGPAEPATPVHGSAPTQAPTLEKPPVFAQEPLAARHAASSARPMR